MANENLYYWINPGITPMPGADILPLYHQPYPAEIIEDTPWLIAHSNKGWAVTDLFAGLTWVTGVYGSPEDLQYWLSNNPWPEDLL